MAANTSPIFGLVPVCAVAEVSAANTNRDGSGTVVDIVTGGTNGTRIDKIRVHARVTTTAGMVRLYYHDGTTYQLWREVVVAAITVAASTPAFDAEVVRADGLPLLVLPSGKKLAASTHNAEAMKVFAEGADY